MSIAKYFLILLIFPTLSATAVFAQKKAMSKLISITHIDEDFPIEELDSKLWTKAEEIPIAKYWSGELAPKERHVKARMLWSDTALYIRFDANQHEPLIISEKPNLASKTRGLWDRDVCEIFIAPDKNDFRKYFEFEIAPNGEWIDLGIQQLPERRETDWNYSSGMKSATKITPKKIIMAMKIEWSAFKKKPQIGDIWLGNIFRCIGRDPKRGYLAWQPTKTMQPNFHVPEAFGEFRFSK